MELRLAVRWSSTARLGVLLLKAINAPLGVYELLLAGVERMALRADVHPNLGHRSARGEGTAATTTIYVCLVILRVNVIFHSWGKVPDGSQSVNRWDGGHRLADKLGFTGASLSTIFSYILFCRNEVGLPNVSPMAFSGFKLLLRLRRAGRAP
jgi:hypothetical protein